MSFVIATAVASLLLRAVPAQADYAARERQLNELVAQIVDSPEPMPSISVAVAYKHKLVFQHVYGYAHIELGVKASESSIYETASISKQFTAAAIMQLVEAKRIQLDDNADQYVPLPPAWQEVKIRHLLSHASGIRSFTEEGRKFDEIAATRSSFQQIIDIVKDKPLAFKPGTGFLYSNTNYLILTKILEAVTGRTFPEILRNSVFAKAGLKHTYFCDTRQIIPGRTRGYRELSGRNANAPAFDSTIQLGHASVCATAADLVKWSLALQSGVVVSRASYDAMKQASSPNYGFGLQLGEFAGRNKVSHGGETAGFNGTLQNYNDGELVVAALSNSESGPARVVAEQIARFFYDQPLLERPRDLELSQSDANRFTGDYDFPRATLRFKYIDGHLTQTTANEADDEYYSTLLYQGNGVFVIRNTITYIKFADDTALEHAASMSFGNGATWKTPNPYLESRPTEPRSTHD